MIPLGLTDRRKKFPFVSILLIFAITGIYVIMYLYGGIEQIIGFALIADRIKEPFELYRIVTYGFLHGSLLHIVFNMLFLWIFGSALESKTGHWTILEIFFLGIIAGGLAQTGVNLMLDARHTLVIGSSGGVSAVMGGYLLKSGRDRMKSILIVFPVKIYAWIFILIWFVYQIIAAVFTRTSGVAYFAHIAGFIFGMMGIQVTSNK
ncbi:MAG: rhomboid family intramembrane serine protease [bacterium]